MKIHKYTTESFIEAAKLVHSDKYDYSLVEYKNSQTKIKIICKECNEIFEQFPNDHLNGHGHYGKCVYKKRFLKKIESDYPNLDTNINYINSKTPVEFTCKIHNYKFTLSPKNLLSTKYGCSKCAGKYKYTTEEFIKTARKLHNNKYDYSLFYYINNKTKSKIICPIHGVFEQTPDNHINQKQGCPKCGNDTLTQEQYIKLAKIAHNNKYTYNNINFRGNKSYITITCPIHGDFTQRADHHLRDLNGCPKCNFSTGEEQIYNYLIENDINYIYQYYTECISDKGKKMPFDFYLPDYNLLIEYQGEQHYSERGIFDNNVEDIKHRDNIKRNYAKNNNIEYLEIPYYNLKSIKEILDENIRKIEQKRVS